MPGTTFSSSITRWVFTLQFMDGQARYTLLIVPSLLEKFENVLQKIFDLFCELTPKQTKISKAILPYILFLNHCYLHSSFQGLVPYL